MIGARIQQARLALGLSLRELSERVEVSAMAISKYERDEITPSSDVLLRLAKALGVRTEYFMREQRVELANLNFRKHEELPERDRARALADVKDQLERWLELEKFIPTPWSKPFALPERLPTSISAMSQIEEVAELVRDAWGLGRNPISDVVDILESNGIKVFFTSFVSENSFNGLSATVEGKPLIIVGSHWPGDRQRFTLAHEVGHFILHGRLAQNLADEDNVEKACNRFAAAFLIPRERVIQVFGEHRSWLEPMELASLKQEWGVSMQSLLLRARDIGVLPQAKYVELYRVFKDQGWTLKEPGEQYRQEKARMYQQLVYRALAEDLVSESKAAELLGMSIVALRKSRHMERAPDAVRH